MTDRGIDPFRREVETLPAQFTAEPELRGSPLSGGSPLIVAGMGGSGLAAELAAGLIRSRPVTVFRDEAFPESSPGEAEVIAVSCSGNTGETIGVWDAAERRGWITAAVATGGALLDRARHAGRTFARVPPGLAPRSSLGHLVRGVLAVAGEDRDATFWNDVRLHLERVRTDWMQGGEHGDDRPPIEALVEDLKGRLPVVMATGWETVAAARRWAGDFAENAQVPAVVWTFPEASHNGIMVAAESAPRTVPMTFIALGSPRDEARRRRWMATRRLLEESGAVVHAIEAPHEDSWVESLGLCYLADWVTVCLAERLGVDAGDIGLMLDLKSRLESLK